MSEKKDQVVQLERQETNDDFNKPVPVVTKQDNFGSHEVCQCSLLFLTMLTHIAENRPAGDSLGEEVGPENHGELAIWC